MSLQATPGFGATIATDLKGNAHHQHIISHKDLLRINITPAVSNVAYTTGKFIGSEMVFNSATRFAGDVATISQVQVSLAKNSSIGNMDLVFYSTTLNTPPVDKAALALLASEITSIFGVVSISSSAFIDLDGNKLATIALPVPLLVQSTAGSSAVKAVLVARSTVTPIAVDAVNVSVLFERA